MLRERARPLCTDDNGCTDVVARSARMKIDRVNVIGSGAIGASAVLWAIACGNGGGGGPGWGTAANSSSGGGPGAPGSSSGTVSPGSSSGAAPDPAASTDAGSGSLPDGAPAVTPGGSGGPVPPFNADQSYSYVRKVKDLLTGLAPTDAEITAAASSTALATLIDGWMSMPQFDAKMIKFFRNVFQQAQFAPADFDFQLRNRPGAFELPYGIYGDLGFPSMFQNLQESIARTALSYVKAGQPLTNVLTTNQFMMTTGLMSLYLQIEMPYDIHTFTFKFNQGTRPPIADTLNPSSPNYLTFGYAKPTTVFKDRFARSGCQGSSTVSSYPGNVNLYQVLLGVVPRDTASGCMEHAIAPYFSPTDQSDWRMVSVKPLAAGQTGLVSYDLPSIRNIAAGGTLALKVERVGFFTTPAFAAVWNTNDSNQHRVTANQTLLAALGEGFTSTDLIVPPQPVSTTGLDPAHAVSGTICYGCHVRLDPLRQFWGNQFDFNDVPVQNARTTGGVFSFGNINQTGMSLTDLGTFLTQVTDSDSTTNTTVNRFALAMAQQLCYFADSAPCSVDDPLFRGIVADFQKANFDFKTLIRELFSSALVTAAGDTKTFQDRGVVVSIARREQFCASVSNRLGIVDICNIDTPTPNGTDVTNRAYDITRLAGAISADSFSRGAQAPVTPSDPNLFFRAAVELVCENLATKVVDVAGAPYASTSASSVSSAIDDLVTKLLAYPPGDPHHAPAAGILQMHYTSAVSQGAASATNALRSTFVAGCESPTSVSIGL